MVFTTKLKFLSLLLVFSTAFYFSTELVSNKSGIVNSLTGCSCHGTNNSATTTTISVTQGTTIDINEEVDIEIQVSNSSMSAFGLNAAVTTSQSGGSNAGSLTAGTGTKVFSSQITHNGPQTGSGSFTFKFKWKAPSSPGTYYVRAQGNATNNNNSSNGDTPNTATTVAITVEDQASVTLNSPNSGNICAGENTTITWSASSVSNIKLEYSINGGTNYTTIENSVDASLGTYTWSVPSALAGNSQIKVKISSIADPSVNDVSSGNVAANGTPSITAQPSSLTTCSGEDIILFVSATGGNLSYTWKKDGSAVPNSNNDTLFLNNVKASDAGSYTVEASTGCGTDALSNTAVLTVKKKPTIDVQPKGKYACEGADLTIESTVSGDDISIKWFKDGVEISGQTASTLNISDFDESMAGDYTLKVTSGACGTEVTSQVAKIVASFPAEITAQPSDKIACEGTEAILFVKAKGTNLTYQWKKDGTDISGATDDTLKIASAAKSDEGEYSVVVSGACDPSATSDVATLTIGELPQITQQQEDITASVGQTATFTITDNGMADNYEWFKDGSSLQTTTVGELTLENLTLADAGEYYVVVSNDCESVQSETFTLTVEEASTPILSLGSSDIDFGVVKVDESGTQQLVISNTGVGALQITSMFITGDNANSFTLQQSTPLQVDEGANITIDIDFQPSGAGFENALLTILTEDSQSGTVNLTGGGRNGDVAAEYTIEGGSTVLVAPNGTASAEITILNNGPDVFSIKSVIFANDTDLSHDADLGTPIAAGEESTFNISYQNDGEASEKTAEFVIELEGVDEDLSGAVLFVVDTGIENAELEGASVFPNPAREQLTLSLGELSGKTKKATIIDINGKEIASAIPQNGEVRFSTQGITSGGYLMLIELLNGKLRYLKVTIR